MRHTFHKTSLIYPLMGILLAFSLLLGGDNPFPTKSVEAATPVAVSTPINPVDWQDFAGALHYRARHFGGSVGYIVEDLHTGRIISTSPDQEFPSASLIKLPIMVAAYQAAQEGRFSLTALITLHHQDRQGGSGVLKFAPEGSVYTNRELLEYMIIHSDNTAAHLIVQQLGFDYIQTLFEKLGLRHTQIHPQGFRLTARRVEEDNITSPSDMAYILERIYKRKMVSPAASDDMLLILKHQKLRDRLPKYLPIGWVIAHKTGLLRRACHDVGIVFSPGGDYLICVLTAHDTTYKIAKHFIASMGRLTFDYYQGGFHRPLYQTRHYISHAQQTS